MGVRRFMRYSETVCHNFILIILFYLFIIFHITVCRMGMVLSQRYTVLLGCTFPSLCLLSVSYVSCLLSFVSLYATELHIFTLKLVNTGLKALVIQIFLPCSNSTIGLLVPNNHHDYLNLQICLGQS